MIRKLSFEDYPAVIELWNKAGLDIRLNGRDHPDKIEKQLAKGTTILLGKSTGKILQGVVIITHDGRKGWINRLAVNPEYQRQGIGKELINRAETLLFDEFGIEVYSALVLKENLNSDHFFSSIGYQKWEEVIYFSRRKYTDS